MWTKYYKKKKSSLTESNAYAACIKKLNYRDYSCDEMREFLLEQEYLSREFANELVAKLVEFSYINEERFAEAIYNSWLNGSLKGKYYLINKLNKHKISEEIVCYYQNMDTYQLELDRAVTLLHRYIQIKKVALTEVRDKAAAHLGNKYYTLDIINTAINIVINIDK